MRHHHRIRLRRTGLGAALVALLGMACSDPLAPDEANLGEYVAGIESWRSEREARLTEPHGWLSLIGLHPLAEGETRIGRSSDVDLRMPRGPDFWGSLSFDGHSIRFEAATGVAATVAGNPITKADLGWRSGEDSNRIEVAGIAFHAIDRAGVPHLRVRDPEAPSRREFVGLSWYPVDRSWAIDAEFEPHPAGTTLRIADITGQVGEQPNPGAVRFVRNGEVHRLQAVQSTPESRLWFIFADGTTGKETYGLGRFLYFDAPEQGRVRLDFNQAYNPPCAFNPHTTCPLPPPSNRLRLPIEAGERNYTGAVGLSHDRTSPGP